MTTNDIIIVLGLLDRARDDAALLFDHPGAFHQATGERRLAAIKAVEEHLTAQISKTPGVPILNGVRFVDRVCKTPPPPTVEYRVGESWIESENRLPPIGENVLVAHNLTVLIACISDSGKWYSNIALVNGHPRPLDGAVKFWKHLPPLPPAKG